ncbi:hypothetical protein ACFVH6_13165 [Spirillospora sp. NPDC127200]
MLALLAASSHSSPSFAAWLALAVVVTIGYLIHCRVYPYRSCRYCDSGKHRSATGRTWRYCRRCGGKGAQLRFGRRVWTYLKDTHRRSDK